MKFLLSKFSVCLSRISGNPVFIGVIIGLATFLSYRHTFQSPFHFDDVYFIQQHAVIRRFDPIWIWQNLYHPSRFISFLSFAANYALHQDAVFGYHVVNTVIHGLNGFLIYWLTRLMLHSPYVLSQHNLSSAIHIFSPLFAALFFVLHPVQIESVTYVCQRFTSLATFFYLMSLCCYVQGRYALSWRWALWAGAGLSAVLGMLSKQITITLPLTLLMSEFFFLHAPRKGSLWQRCKDWRLFIGMGILAVFLCVIPFLYAFQVSSMLSMRAPSNSHPGDFLTPFSYFLTQSRVVMTYARLIFFPIAQNLLYDFPMSTALWQPLTTLLCFMGIALMGFFSLQLFRRHRLISFGILWFLMTLSVESTFIVIKHVIFEHRLYLPLVGVAMALAGGGLALMREPRKALGVVLVVSVVLGGLTYQRNRVWQTREALWTDVAHKIPHRGRPYASLASIYVDQKQYDKALPLLNKAIALNPKQFKAHNNRGILLKEKGRLLEAIDDFDVGLMLDPGNVEALNNRGNTYQQLGRYPEALDDFNDILKRYPYNVQAYGNRAVVYGEIGEYAKALRDIEIALQGDSGNVHYENNRCVMYFRDGQFQKAVESCCRVLAKNPNYVQAYHNRGLAYKRLGKLELALKDFNEALLLDPYFHLAYNDRGIVWGLLQNYDNAIKDFTQVIALDGDLASAYFNRALAYKLKGNMKQAFADQQKAQSLGYQLK